MRHAEPHRQHRRIAVVPVEKLDDAGRFARRAHTFLDAIGVNRVDQPDAALVDEGVGAALQPLVGDPAEPARELVAEPDLHARCHCEAKCSASGIPEACVAASTASTS